MIRNAIQTGTNRTGTETAPEEKALLLEGAEQAVPSMEGDGSAAIDDVRAEYIAEDVSIGSLSPPVLREDEDGDELAREGGDLPVFIDKLGERLAFERTGTRLYGALLGKLDASEPLPDGPTRGELEEIYADELAHFLLVREAMLLLGADPTAITPSADVSAVSSSGILQVIADPRTSLEQSLAAILIAELVDNDGWRMLVQLADAASRSDLVSKFEAALAEEDDHLRRVRGWVERATLAEARREEAASRQV